MEARLLQRVNLDLENSAAPLIRFGALVSAGALLANVKISNSTRVAVVDALGRLVIRSSADTAFLRCVVKLLGDLATFHRAFAPHVFQLLIPLLHGNKALALDALASLSSMDGFLPDYNLLLPFASSAIASLRSMAVRLLVSSLDDDKSSIVVMNTHCMIPLLLGLADDIYPLIRSKAVDGLASLCRQTSSGVSLQSVKCLYGCAASLLRNENELVRLSAVKLIGSCGQVLERNKACPCYSQLMDAIFLQLCVMVRDMNMKVRVEAFSNLQKVQGVSENILLQSLSKKILGTQTVQNPLIEHNLRNSKSPFSSSPGAFLHGIEDEFHEVRLAACKSLGTLTVRSVQFATAAVDLLMDLLNDDAIAVRLQCLEALYRMATNDQLAILEKHMDMLLGPLNDVSAITRYAARKLLRSLKLPKCGLLKATIDSLLINLEAHPEEEEDVLSILFWVGIQNAKFASMLANEFALTFGAGELSLDAPRVAGQLVFIIASIFSNNQKITDIPPVLICYIAPLVGRISRCMKGFLSQNWLSDHLCNRSGISASFGLPVPQETELTTIKLEEALANSLKCRDHLWSLLLLHDKDLKIEFKEDILNPCYGSTCSELLFHQEELVIDRLAQSIKFILRKVQDTWPLIHSHSFLVAVRRLRACREELNIISSDTSGSGADFVAFALEYVLVIKLLAEIWQHIHAKNFQITGMASLDILIEKLEKSLRQIKYCFRGLSVEEESHILELILLGHVLQLHRAGICSHDKLKKMHAAKSRLQILHEETSNISTGFCDELKKDLSEEGLSESFRELPIDKLLKLFYLSPTPFRGNFRHIKAELKAFYSNSENPLPFISGLPIGITFQFILYNIPRESQVWLRMAFCGSVQYIFIDLFKVGDCDDGINCTLTLPFYATPRAVSFILKACVFLELPVGVALHLKKERGPRHDSMQISEEVDVYFARIQSH